MKVSIFRLVLMSLVALGGISVLLMAVLTKEISQLGYCLLAGTVIALAATVALEEVLNILKNKKK